MNLTSAKTRDYNDFRLCGRHKNKAKTKPNKANPASPVASPRQVRKMAKMNVSSIETDDYGKNPAFAKIKTKPIQSQSWISPRTCAGGKLWPWKTRQKCDKILKNR